MSTPKARVDGYVTVPKAENLIGEVLTVRVNYPGSGKTAQFKIPLHRSGNQNPTARISFFAMPVQQDENGNWVVEVSIGK